MDNNNFQEKLNSLLLKLIGEEVEHVVFGLGVVEEADDSYVVVQYQNVTIPKSFQTSHFFKFNTPVNKLLIDEYKEIYKNFKSDSDNTLNQTHNNSNNELETRNNSNKITFDNVIGLEDVKEEINKLIVFPFKYKEIYQAFNRSSGGGVLLYGAQGCGKTMIAKAIANEVNAKLFTIKCSDIKTKWYGSSEKKIKDLFSEARSYNKSIIFFDEFDSLGVNRDSNNSSHDKNLVAELLTQIDGVDSKNNDNTLLLLAATNKPWNIDSALLRNGRFGKKIFVSLPNNESAIKIIKQELKNVPKSKIDYNKIIDCDNKLSSADVVALCNEAKDIAIKRSIANNKISEITTRDLIEAKSIVKPTINNEELNKLKEFSM